MKRKIFNVSPIVASKTDNKMIRDSLAARQISPPPSPLICRRPLSPTTEAELKAACYALVEDYSKPSGSGRAREVETKSKVDFETLHRTMRERRTELQAARAASQVQAAHRQPEVYNSTAPARQPESEETNDDPFPDFDGTFRTERTNINRTRGQPRPAPGRSELPVRATTSYAFLDTSHYDTPLKHGGRPKTAPPAEVEETSDSYSTPLSGSTDDQNLNHISTAITSVGITPTKQSKRYAGHVGEEPSTSRADSTVAEWTRQELERRRRSQSQHLEQQHEPLPPTRASRASSKARSIRDEIRNHIRPRSSASRTASRESLRSKASRESLARTPSAQARSSSYGWHSWGLHRKSSDRSLSSGRESSERGHGESHPRKREIDLNRELPPLPGLDKWQEPGQPPKSHIASQFMARTQMSDGYSNLQSAQQDSGHAASSFSTKAADGLHTCSEPSNIRAMSSPSVQDVPDPRDFHVSATAATQHSCGPETERQASPRPYQNSTSNGLLPACNASNPKLNAEPPNFSRKISTDNRPSRGRDTQYPNVFEIVALKSPTVDVDEGANKGGLKKIFSVFGGRKHKQMTWMDRMEKEGVREGIMYEDEAAGAPIVRY